MIVRIEEINRLVKKNAFDVRKFNSDFSGCQFQRKTIHNLFSGGFNGAKGAKSQG